MQVEIDFGTWKKLTLLRSSEQESENDVINRLIEHFGDPLAADSQADDAFRAPGRGSGFSALYVNEQNRYNGGITLGGHFFPNKTQFRMSYNGEDYYADIIDGQWINRHDHSAHGSPSAAASAITGYNTNGWRVWQVWLPGENAPRPLSDFKK